MTTNQKTDNASGVAFEQLVSASPYNALLREWQHRTRTMGRDVAHHTTTLRRVMAALDEIGPSEAGDCIQSLVFELQIVTNRAQRLADELSSREMTTEFPSADDAARRDVSALSDGLGVCRLLPPTLARESGGGYGFVCIWRIPRDGSDEARRCTVAEFLSQPENAGGTWYIDGGWGGPPGPIRVDWDEAAKAWRNRGFPPWN